MNRFKNKIDSPHYGSNTFSLSFFKASLYVIITETLETMEKLKEKSPTHPSAPSTGMPHHIEKIRTVGNCTSRFQPWKSFGLRAFQTCDHTAHSSLHLLLVFCHYFKAFFHIGLGCILFPPRHGIIVCLTSPPRLLRHRLYIRFQCYK